MLYTIIILIILVELALITFITVEIGFLFLLLFMESRLKTHQHNPMPDIPNVKTLIKVSIFEIIYTYIRHPFRLLYLIPKSKKLKKADHCLVLIHGYGRNDKDWVFFKRLIKPKLPKNIEVAKINVAYLKNDLDNLSLHVLQELTAIKSATGATRMTLIGHSLGGVMSAYVVERFPETKKYIKDIITLGSPLHGTKLAVFGVGDCSKAIFPGSDTLDKLTESIRNSEVNYHMAASCCDHLIIPWDSAIVPSRHNTAIYDSLGHLSMLYSRKVVDQILSWLKIRD